MHLPGRGLLFAEDVQVAEHQPAVADPGQEIGELPGLGPTGILHALLPACELHHEQVPVLSVAVPSQHGLMWYPMAIGPGHPLIQPRVEFVNAPCGELDDLRELH
jgi:hypothetical protein